MKIKTKINKWGLIKLKNLHIKKKLKVHKKATLRMGGKLQMKHLAKDLLGKYTNSSCNTIKKIKANPV